MILIVDDAAFLEKAQEMLNRERQVFLASDSRQAFRLAENLGFSVVLVDLGLQSDDSLTPIRQIHERFPGLPIIAISDGQMKAAIRIAPELGVAEVLHKPITPEWKPVVERITATAHRLS